MRSNRHMGSMLAAALASGLWLGAELSSDRGRVETEGAFGKVGPKAIENVSGSKLARRCARGLRIRGH